MYQLLDALVERHVQTHAGDAQQSLAAISSASAIRRDLQAIADPDVQASLSLVSQATHDAEATVGYPTSGASAGPRFRILRPHARGGLGEVFVAEDTELHREVALKQIDAQRAHDQPSRGRFVLEAEITGGLEHPGIVPVYGLGTYDDGRPFYAMRFVRGDNLKEAIRRFHGKAAELERGGAEQDDGKNSHAERTPAEDATDRNLAFRDLLGRFVDVCNAVAYAHSRGVLHRDLKPGNVMLGKYGETLLVDWGLAKVTGKSDTLLDVNEPALRPASAESGLAETQAGSAIGTPAYMSPEQAAGRVDLLGPSSDIYSLGATLYTLLTGRPPFEGNTAEILRKVQARDFPPPRQLKPALPAALEAVCLKAMAQRPEDRYQSALQLAADVEHWLADEPVGAWREPLRVKLSRWIRRHKALVSSAVAALFVALVAVGAGAFWYQAEQARQAQEQADRDTREAARQAQLAAQREYLDKEISLAMSEATVTQKQLHEQLANPAMVHELLSDIDAWLRQVLKARQAWQQAKKLADSSTEPLDAAVLEKLQALDASLKTDEANYELARKLDAARLEAQTVVGGRFRFTQAIKKYQDAFRQAHLEITDKTSADVVAASIAQSPLRHVLLAALDTWANYLPENSPVLPKLLEIARRVDPDPWRDQIRDPLLGQDLQKLRHLAKQAPLETADPALLVVLAIKLSKEDYARAVTLLRSALLIRPKNYWLHFGIGRVVKDPGERVGVFRSALTVRPDNAWAYNGLGNALYDQRDFDGAIQCYQKALRIDPNYAWVHNNLGNSLVEKGKLREAEKYFQKAKALDPTLAAPYIGVANIQHADRDLKSAEKNYRQAIALDDTEHYGHNGLANVLTEQGKFDEAIDCYRKALKLKPDLHQAYNGLGNILYDRGDFDGAIKTYEAGLTVAPKDAYCHNGRGMALCRQGKFVEAIESFKQAEKYGYQPPPGGLPSNEYLKRCERFLELEKRLPAILDRTVRPKNAAEQLEFASLCYHKELHAAATRLHAEAFAADPNLQAAARYDAACAAALAGVGKAKDTSKLDDKEKQKLRQQALTWLQAELAVCKDLLKAGPQKAIQARADLIHWQHDGDLFGVRDAKELARLPQEERRAWQDFWAEVSDLAKAE